jgi:Holliday junction resolvase RusA-like endonuclease
MNSTLHQSKPDIDNLTKAFFDAILKEDKKIGHLSSISKIWTSKEKGWIEVRIDPPKIKAQQFPKKQKDMYL